MPANELGDHSYVAYVSVDDIDGLYGEFVSRGVPIRIPPETKPWECGNSPCEHPTVTE
jgi:hypothetical protein